MPMQTYEEYAREHLQAALDNMHNTEVLVEVQQGLMALHLAYGSTGTIVLDPADIQEDIRPTCICPAGLPDRGGFRSGCKVHHLTP